MEAKLIKKNDIFYLYVDESWSIASTDVKDNRDKKLSLKNCQAIERGYDLENMADFYGAKVKGSVDFKLGANQGFEDGFKQALEILIDKKFSKDDIIDCWETAHQAGRFEEKGIAETNWQTAINYAQSLQQTEWDVEIVMEYVGKIKLNKLHEMKPKLDTHGCLILKRI